MDSAIAPVTIQLDGRSHPLARGSTLAQLVQQQGHAQDAVSTAVNGSFVPRSARDRVLKDGDAVLFFQPVVGG